MGGEATWWGASQERLKAVVLNVVRAQYVKQPSMSEREVQVSQWSLPLDSWWYPTAGVPGWACGHARQPRQTLSRVAWRPCGGSQALRQRLGVGFAGCG